MPPLLTLMRSAKTDFFVDALLRSAERAELNDYKNKAWAHWHLNDDATRGSKPISYAELVKQTGIDFLPGAQPKHEGSTRHR